MYRDPETIYGVKKFDEKSINAGETFRELPLGSGAVPFPEYLKALEDIGFKGFLTIEREVGEDPLKDIKIAYDFLKNIING